MQVYVAGPVLGRWRFSSSDEARKVRDVYDHFRGRNWRDVEFRLPVEDDDFGSLDPADFFRHTIREIVRSSAVIGVLVRADPHTTAEIVSAAHLGLPLVIVSDMYASLPRLVRGLPGVMGVHSLADAQSMSRRRLRELEKQDEDLVSQREWLATLTSPAGRADVDVLGPTKARTTRIAKASVGRVAVEQVPAGANPAIRAWARRKGIKVAATGRIRREVTEEYKAAQAEERQRNR
jgi:Lsr2